jgi:hypothetical protein
VERALEANDSDEAYRLAKATYVQIRKSNKTLSAISEEVEHNHEQDIVAGKAQHDEVCMLMADYINKATKVMVKYNETNNDKVLETLTTLSAQLAEIKLEMGGEGASQGTDYTAVLNDITGKLDRLKINVTQSAGESVSESADIPEMTAAPTDDAADAAGVSDTDDEEDEIILAQRAIQALNGVEAPAAEAVQEPVQEAEPAVESAAAPVSDDPNKQLSADEIAALFAASKEERKAESDDDFKVEEHPEAMDQGLIDALLSLDDSDKKENAAQGADVIQFPGVDSKADVAEAAPESVPEPVAAAPVSDDPNKQLSADEIAALFAAAAPAAESKPEPEPVAVTPVSDDPNKQLSPDEIAALFSSMSG